MPFNTFTLVPTVTNDYIYKNTVAGLTRYPSITLNLAFKQGDQEAFDIQFTTTFANYFYKPIITQPQTNEVRSCLQQQPQPQTSKLFNQPAYSRLLTIATEIIAAAETEKNCQTTDDLTEARNAILTVLHSQADRKDLFIEATRDGDVDNKRKFKFAYAKEMHGKLLIEVIQSQRQYKHTTKLCGCIPIDAGFAEDNAQGGPPTPS